MVELGEDALGVAFSVMLPHLDERSRRIVSGSLARALGRGGVAFVARNLSRGLRHERGYLL